MVSLIRFCCSRILSFIRVKQIPEPWSFASKFQLALLRADGTVTVTRVRWGLSTVLAHVIVYSKFQLGFCFKQKRN